jgi:hypothetical protein
MFTRRDFMAASAAALAQQMFAAPVDSKAPNADLEKLGAVALTEAKKFKASYADIRIVRLRDQRIGTRLSPERGTGKTLAVPTVAESSSFGFGVRVIVNGAGYGRGRHYRQGECHHPTPAGPACSCAGLSRPLGDAL